jgi:hypothetical protein
VARVSAFSPAAAWYFLFFQYFVFALYERKNEIHKKKRTTQTSRCSHLLRAPIRDVIFKLLDQKLFF